MQLGAATPRLTTLVQIGLDGTVLDPDAVDPESGDALPITSVALERDAFRADGLAITASMGTEEAGWAGIYLTKLPSQGGGK